MKISVILPAFNEESTIKATILDFHSELPKSEIWIIDNRSNDNTYQIAIDTLAELGCLGGVIKENRPGKGNAVRRAFQEINSDVYILADADLTYPASEATALIEYITSGEADMVVGDRHSSGHYKLENKRIFHGAGNMMVRGLVNKMFKANLADIMSGYRVLSRRFVKNYPILVEGFEIETDMTLHALDKRFRIVEVPIKYRDRPFGSVSKLNTFRDGMRVLWTISSILRYYRPLAFFGSLAFTISLIGLLAGVAPIQDWIYHRYIYHLPSAVLSASLGIIALILFAVGLILDSLAHQDRRAFEREILNSNY